MESLRHKRVLVTGGARGIGWAIAERFASEGAYIVLTDIDAESLEEAGGRLDAAGAEWATYQLDVTDSDSMPGFQRHLREEIGGIDVLVNNAGTVVGGAFLEVPLAKHQQTFRINVEGVVAMTHAFLGDLIAGEDGHLVNIASASGFVGLPWGSTYAASKWAVIGFGESIRLELKRLGHEHVGVTSVCPSYVDTGMFEGVKTPLLTDLLTPEALADKVHRAVLKNDPFVLEPKLIKLTPLLKGALPTGATDWLLDTLGASNSMESWKGHGSE